MDVGTHAFSFLVEDNITRSMTYRVEIRIEKTVGPTTYLNGGYFTVDVDVLDVWTRMISSTTERTELELIAVVVLVVVFIVLRRRDQVGM